MPDVYKRQMLNKGDHPYMKEQAYQQALAFNPNIVVIKLGTCVKKKLKNMLLILM